MKINSTAALKGLIQLGESLLLTAFMAGIISMSNVLTGSGSINTQLALTSFGIAFLFSLGHGIFAYAKYIPAPAVQGSSQPQVTPAQVGSELDSVLTTFERKVAPSLVGPAIVAQQSTPIASTASQIQPPEVTGQMPVVQAPAQQQ